MGIQRRIQNDEVFNLIIENLNDYALILTDGEWQITNWNAGIYNFLGYAENEFVGQTISIIFTPEDISAGVFEKKITAAQTQQSTEKKYWIQRRDGSRFWANCKIIALKNDDGNLRGFAFLVRDEIFEKPTANLETILSGISDSFFQFDRDFRYVYVNRATTEMFGIPENQFLGKTLWELFPDVDKNIFHREVQRALKKQETIVFENYYEPLDRWFENRVYPAADGLSVFTTEITERKKIETALKQSEEKYRTLFDSIDSGFCVIELMFDDDGKLYNYKYLEINPSFEKQSGIHNAVGKTIRDFAPDHEDFWFDTYMQVSVTGEPVRFEHYSSGLENWFEVYAFRFSKSQTNPLAVVFNNITKRKLAEEEIKKLNEQSSRILESINDAFFALDTDWNFTYLNNQAEVLLKRTREELLDKNIWEEFAAAVGTTFYEQYQKALKEQTTVTFEEYYPPLETWFEVRGYPSANGLSVYFHNIDERRKAEKSLIEAEARYRALIEATSTTVWHANPEGALTFVGEKWTEVSGQTVEEILKWGWLEAIHPDDRERTIEVWKTALRDKTLYETEFRVLTASDEYRWFAVNAVPIFNADGSVREWIGLNTDINDRKNSETLLRESERQFSTLADVVPQLVWMAEADGFIFWYNRNWYEYTGTTPEDMQGWGWQSVHDPEILPRVMQGWTDSLKRGEMFEMEFPLKGADGKFRWFLTRVNPFKDTNGEIIRWFGTNTDIDVQRRLDEQNRFIITVDEAVRPLETPHEITLTLARMLGEYLKVDRCAYAEVEEDEDHFTIPGDYTRGDTISLVGNYSMADFGTEVLRLMRENKPYIVNDVNTDPQVTEDDLAAYRLTTIKSVICVPLHKNGKFNACMAVHQRVPREWTAEEVELVQFFANRFWESIERARTNNNLRESEERFRNMADNAPMMVWVTEPDGSCTYLSQSWYEFTGQTPETALGFGWVEAVHPEDQQFTHDTFVTANSNRNIFRVEYRLRRKDGSYAWAIDSAQPRFSDNGDFLGYVGSVFDITERKKDEEALLERTKLATLYGDIGNALVQTENLENLLKRCAEIIVEYLDVAFARIWTIDEAEKVLELRASAGLYTHLDGPHSRIPVGQFKIGKIAQDRKPHLTNDVANDSRIGDAEWAKREKMKAFAGYPLIIEDRIVGVIGMFSRNKISDLTLEAMESVANGIANGIDRKQIEEKRRQLLSSEQEARQTAENANRLKDEFLATLSHELRTPLNAILGWSQMVQSRDLSESQMQKAFQTIERSARSQNQLIDDLLDVSRIITGKLRLDVRAVELSNVITAAVDAVRPAAEAKNIRLQTLLDPQAGPISGDPDRLQQVVWNLLSNAVKFTPKEGRVQVRLERVNSHIEIVISDTGKGIEAEFLPYVFDRFRQSDGSMTRRHGGLGLGLAIVRQLVELHGGTVNVTSAGENQGSTFTVFLPLLPVRTEPLGDETRVHPARNDNAEFMENYGRELSGLCILLVEDEADSRDLLSVVLTTSGAEVATAESAAEALEKLKSEKFDVIISDIGMPDEDGFSLISKIRSLQNEQNFSVPAIALTAYARAEDRIKALRCGFQLHIAKPVESTELIAAVANLAGRIEPSNQ